MLYHRVSAAQRVRLHQRIGARLEAGHGAQAGDISAELAMHFARGRDAQRAVQYLRQAGQRSLERSAYVEAAGHLTRALEVLKTLPATPERTQQELTLHIALGMAMLVTKGHAAPEVEHTYAQARALCQQVEETPQFAQTLYGLIQFYLTRSQLYAARELGETLLGLAHHAGDPALAVIAHYAFGCTGFFLGMLPAARLHLEAGIAHYAPEQRRVPVFQIGQDPGVAGRAFAAITLWFLGYPEQALARLHEALALAHELSHPYSHSLAFVRCWAAYVYQLRHDVPAVHKEAEAALTLSIEYGFPAYVAQGTLFRGWALAIQDQDEEGLAQVRQGIAAWRTTGEVLQVPYLCTVLAEISAHLGYTEDGLQALSEAHTIVEQHENRWWEAEVHRLRGILLLRQTMSQQEVRVIQPAMATAPGLEGTLRFPFPATCDMLPNKTVAPM